MFFPESDTIAAKSPDLFERLCLLDQYLYDLGPGLVRLDRTADILRLEPGTLRRLLRLYERLGLVEQDWVSLCPQDKEILATTDDGVLWCDICERTCEPSECIQERVYRVRPDKVRVPEDLPTFDDGYALLIGIGAYENLVPLGKTMLDAQDLYDLLVDPSYAGYPQSNVHLLLDREATKGAIASALKDLAARTGPNHTVVIFFSGHGVQETRGAVSREYLCPVEADLRDVEATAISTSDLTEALGAIPASRIAVFLDACHSGGIGQVENATAQFQEGLSDGAYNRLAGGQGRVIIASCGPDEVSWEREDLDNGVFAYSLLKGLRGEAPRQDGVMRISAIFHYVSSRVPLLADQHPVFKGVLRDDFAIVAAPTRR